MSVTAPENRKGKKNTKKRKNIQGYLQGPENRENQTNFACFGAYDEKENIANVFSGDWKAARLRSEYWSIVSV